MFLVEILQTALKHFIGLKLLESNNRRSSKEVIYVPLYIFQNELILIDQILFQTAYLI